MTYIEENMITKLQKLYSLPRNPRRGINRPRYLRKNLCTGNLSPVCKIFIKRPGVYFFSSLIPSYLLKVTKFLSKISWFEFFVMTEKNIFAYKLFVSLNISDF